MLEWDRTDGRRGKAAIEAGAKAYYEFVTRHVSSPTPWEGLDPFGQEHIRRKIGHAFKVLESTPDPASDPEHPLQAPITAFPL